MKESYEEDLASHFGLRWRCGSGNAFVLSVHLEGKAGQPLSSEINSPVGRPCLPEGKAALCMSIGRDKHGHGGV